MVRWLVFSVLVLGLAPAAVAAENPYIAIALHVQELGGDCVNHGVYDCFQIVTSWPAADQTLDFYVFVCGHGWADPFGFHTVR